jgi:hypothetical protein
MCIRTVFFSICYQNFLTQNDILFINSSHNHIISITFHSSHSMAVTKSILHSYSPCRSYITVAGLNGEWRGGSAAWPACTSHETSRIPFPIPCSPSFQESRKQSCLCYNPNILKVTNGIKLWLQGEDTFNLTVRSDTGLSGRVSSARETGSEAVSAVIANNKKRICTFRRQW